MKHISSLLLLLVARATFGAEAGAKQPEQIRDPSPDAAFAMRVLRGSEADPEGIVAVDLIAMSSKKVVASLLSAEDEWAVGGVSLLWSPDSRRCAFQFSTSPRFREMRMFERVGKTFRKISLPDLGLHRDWIEGKPQRFHLRNQYITPERWLKSCALVVNYECIFRRWAPGQENAEADGLGVEMTLTPPVNGAAEIRSVRGGDYVAGVGDLGDRAQPGRMRGPGVRPGRPDAFELGYEISCLSPDGKFGILTPKPDVFGEAAEAARNFIVTTNPLRVIGLLDLDRIATSGLRANWNPAQTAAIVTVEAMTMPRAVRLLEFREGSLARQTDLLAAIAALFLADFRASKAQPWDTNRRPPFAILDDESWSWRWNGDRIDLACQATSNPVGGGTDGTRVWYAKMEAAWNLSDSRFTDVKVTRTFGGAVPDDDVMHPEKDLDEDESPAKVEAEAAKENAVELTLLRAPGDTFSITWNAGSRALTFRERDQPAMPLKSMKQLIADPATPSPEPDSDSAQTPPLCFLSPDGDWLLVLFRDSREIMLYPHSEEGWNLGGNDESVEELQLQAGRFLMSEAGLEGADAESGILASFIDWSDDSTRLLLRFDGYLTVPEDHPRSEEGALTIDGWLCYYNLRTGKFELTDRLREHNRWAIGRGNGQPDDWEAQAPLNAEPIKPGEVPPPAGTRFAAADRQLNVAYKKAVKRLPASQRDALRIEQRGWLAHRDVEASIHAVQSWSPFPEAARLEGAALATEARVRELEQAPSPAKAK